ncbi:MAG: type II toxin-antitoxin system death-on-curing family toxin [Deltaproteobacteria bacterium]|nr:type II toxin-antitoxin system death-on-curing family toxin [Deltaproteobacteria bacterium]
MIPVTYLTAEEILALHEISINEFGGSRGIRDVGLLESAAYQPRQGFGGVELYPEIRDKASALGYSISENQPFIDGNKRTAALSMLVFLDINGYQVSVPRGAIHQIMVKVANKRCSRQELADWLKKNSKPVKGSRRAPTEG